jgi:anti-sigma B factor antagonist
MDVDEPVLRIMERALEGGTVVLTVQGEVDMATVDGLRARLTDACERGAAVTVDLRRVSFLDCTGLRLLLEQAELSARSGCELELIPGPPCVQRLFELTGAAERLRFVSAGGARLAAAAGA